jgi:NAD+ synthase
MKDPQKVIDHIVHWLQEYAGYSQQKGFVVGISGGIDSALTSTLCALTGWPTCCVELPLHQPSHQESRAHRHVLWLQSQYEHVEGVKVDLTVDFDRLTGAWNKTEDAHLQHLTLANTRSRLRMLTLYYQAGIRRALVVGTGNKVEDFGVGFYTKYGDGGVDISPIADLKKTEVRALAAFLGIHDEIVSAPPTDGLWEDDRSDEDQMGATYPELEWAMDFCENYLQRHRGQWILENTHFENISERQQEVLKIYVRLHNANRHKMVPIPICEIPSQWK